MLRPTVGSRARHRPTEISNSRIFSLWPNLVDEKLLDKVVAPPSPEVVPAVLVVKRLVVGATVLAGLTKDEEIIVIGGLKNLRSLKAPSQALTNRRSVMVP